MVKKFSKFEPQLVVAEQSAGSAIHLTNEQKLSLYKKSQKSGISTDVLEEVYRRGYSIWNESFGQNAEQFAFDRVNSFISGGFAADLDDDLIESLDKAFPFKYHGQDEDGIHKYSFTPGKDSSKISVLINHNPNGNADVVFHKGEDDSQENVHASGEHPKTAAKVFGTVGKIMQSHGSKHSDDVNNFVFSADKSEPSRVSLYRKIAQRHGGEELSNTSKYQTGFKVPNPASSNVNEDLMTERKRGLWDNIHAKRERIKHGSGEHMRKPGSKGAPTDAAIKASQIKEDEVVPNLPGRVEGSSYPTRAPVGTRYGSYTDEKGRKINKYVDQDLTTRFVPDDEGEWKPQPYPTRAPVGTVYGSFIDKDGRKMNKVVGADLTTNFVPADVNEDADPCWKGYEQIGMKKKNGRKVPNCVPVKEENDDEAAQRQTAVDAVGRKLRGGRDAPPPLTQQQQQDDAVDTALDYASMVPGPIGIAAGLGSAGRNLYKGKYVDAAIDTGGALLAGVGGKLIAKGAQKGYQAAKSVFKEEVGSKKKYDPGHMVSMEQPWHPEDPNVSYRKNFHKEKQKEIKDKLEDLQAGVDKIKQERLVKMEAYTGAETTTTDFTKPNSRFIGTNELTQVYKNMTPGQSITQKRIKTIKEAVFESYVCEDCNCGLAEELINERGADSKGYKRPTEAGAGLTQKGVEHYRRQNPGSKLSTAVTEKNPKGRRAARRRSFCARMSGVKGPMKDEKGRPTRKAMSLRRWRCR